MNPGGRLGDRITGHFSSVLPLKRAGSVICILYFGPLPHRLLSTLLVTPYWADAVQGREVLVANISRNGMALAAVLVVNVLLIILLTPLGFETRPPSDLKPVGYVAIGTIFAGLILDLASIGLLFRRVRLASKLAVVGSILFFLPIFGDQTGSFFSLPIPPTINTLEYIYVVVLLVTLFLASKVYREIKPASSR